MFVDKGFACHVEIVEFCIEETPLPYPLINMSTCIKIDFCVSYEQSCTIEHTISQLVGIWYDFIH